jgi:hypothetical protein
MLHPAKEAFRVRHKGDRMKRVTIALAVGAAVFGIASAVQASIPDASGIVHACYTNTNLNGYPPGALRAIDTAKLNGHCSQGTEAPVDLATPQYVLNQIQQAFLNNSQAYYASGETTLPGADAHITLASVTVPPGNYIATGTGWGAGETAGVHDQRCYINQPNGDPKDTFYAVGLDGTDTSGQQSWAVHALVARPFGGTISVGCLSDQGSVLTAGQIVAEAVGTLNGPTVAAPPANSGQLTGKASG